jgi:hypothetical protein
MRKARWCLKLKRAQLRKYGFSGEKLSAADDRAEANYFFFSP